MFPENFADLAAYARGRNFSLPLNRSYLWKVSACQPLMIRVVKGGDRQAYDPPARLSTMQKAVRKAEDVKACGKADLAELAAFFAHARDAARAGAPRRAVGQDHDGDRGTTEKGGGRPVVQQLAFAT